MASTVLTPGSTNAIPVPENKLHYPALDGIRAVAVLMVFCVHYGAESLPVLWWGWCGVDIFFVLSGFLITGILFDTRDSPHKVRNFYGRRSLRIFPLYYGVLLLGLLLEPVFRWQWHPAWFLWPLYLGNYVHFIWPHAWRGGVASIEALQSTSLHLPSITLNFQHFWSLCVEEQFYLVWPLVVFTVKDRVRLRNICLAVCALALVLRLICHSVVPEIYLRGELLYRATPFRADALLLGGMIALMLRGREAALLTRVIRPSLYFFIAGFAIFQATYRLQQHSFYFPVSRSGGYMSTFGFTLIDLFAGIVILMALDESGPVYRFFTRKPLQSLGRISYGFYVFHDIPHNLYDKAVAHWFPQLAQRNLVVALVALGSTLVFSAVSFRFYEKPFLKLKRHFA